MTEVWQRLCFKGLKKKKGKKIISNNNLWSHLLALAHEITSWVYLLLNLQCVSETRLTLNATGSVLLHRQWEGRTEQRKFGLSVRTSSAGWSAMISAMLRFSWGRSLGTAAAASGCPVGELTSFIFPGTGWRLLDGGLNLRVALGSTGIRITTAWIIKQPPKSHPTLLNSGRNWMRAAARWTSARLPTEKKKGCERTGSTLSTTNFSGRLEKTKKYTSSSRQTEPSKTWWCSKRQTPFPNFCWKRPCATTQA